MNSITAKYLSKSRLNQVLFILAVTFLPLLFLSFLGCGKGAGSGGNSDKSESEPKLGVVVTSIDTNECPNVKVKVSITDENNQLIEDDPALVVTLYEDGVEQTDDFSLVWLGNTPSPVTVVFAMDYSSSMDDSREDMENGVKAFIDDMKPADRAAVIKFNQKPQLMVGLTSDKVALYSAVDELPSEGNDTNIYDSVFDAVGILTGIEGPSAVILFTDGQHDPGDYPIQHTLEEVVDYAIAQNIIIFSIAYDLRDDSDLRYLSEETGGIYYEVLEPLVINEVYLSLFELLEKQHLITYACSSTDGLEHSIQIISEYGGIIGESSIQNFISCTIP